MSTQEDETTEVEEEPFAPAGNLDDLFTDDYTDDVEETDETVDDQPADNLTEEQLRARLAKAEKAAAFEREQRVKSAKANWLAEAKQHFPYSSPDTIQADSRRSFLEQAKKQDQEFRERAKGIIDKQVQTREEIEAEVRAEMEKSWGRPTIGVGMASPVALSEEETDKKLASARQRKSMKDAVTALIDGGRI